MNKMEITLSNADMGRIIIGHVGHKVNPNNVQSVEKPTVMLSVRDVYFSGNTLMNFGSTMYTKMD